MEKIVKVDSENVNLETTVVTKQSFTKEQVTKALADEIEGTAIRQAKHQAMLDEMK